MPLDAERGNVKEGGGGGMGWRVALVRREKDSPRQGMTARPERWAIWRPINGLQLSPTWPPKPFPAVSFPNREPRHSLSPRCLQTVSRQVSHYHRPVNSANRRDPPRLNSFLESGLENLLPTYLYPSPAPPQRGYLPGPFIAPLPAL